MNEIEAHIYGHKIGIFIYFDGTVYFEYDEDFKKLGLEISPLKLNTQKTPKKHPKHISTGTIHPYIKVLQVFFLILCPTSTVWLLSIGILKGRG